MDDPAQKNQPEEGTDILTILVIFLNIVPILFVVLYWVLPDGTTWDGRIILACPFILGFSAVFALVIDMLLRHK
jgi:hypothetical protein